MHIVGECLAMLRRRGITYDNVDGAQRRAAALRALANSEPPTD